MYKCVLIVEINFVLNFFSGIIIRLHANGSSIYSWNNCKWLYSLWVSDCCLMPCEQFWCPVCHSIGAYSFRFVRSIIHPSSLYECNSSEVVGPIAFKFDSMTGIWLIAFFSSQFQTLFILQFWFYNFCRSYGTFNVFMQFRYNYTLWTQLLWPRRSESFHI
jgi:hypothetical protein